MKAYRKTRRLIVPVAAVRVRGPVAQEIAEDYPNFANRVWATAGKY